ncbi:MAG: Sec-independent protein translocase protein TatB [Pseudomonadota bacterium]
MSLVPQLGLPEILVLSVLALLVIGPKDLPRFLNSAGKMVGKARRLADEFRQGITQMAREAEMEDMRREIENLKKSSGADEMSSAMRDIEKAANAPAASSPAAADNAPVTEVPPSPASTDTRPSDG